MLEKSSSAAHRDHAQISAQPPDFYVCIRRMPSQQGLVLPFLRSLVDRWIDSWSLTSLTVSCFVIDFEFPISGAAPIHEEACNIALDIAQDE
jgi:hypothetical protein